jgi:3',5'-cyclic AMP phosphodiesterase CpdA
VTSPAVAAATAPLRPVNDRQLSHPGLAPPFTFAVTGDGRPTVPGLPFPRVTHRIFEELRLLGPAFVLYPGDAIFGYGDTRGEMLQELDAFARLADRAAVPVYNAPGNHEMQSRPEAVEALREWGHDLYGSFDFRGCHFIVLNTDEVLLEGRVAGEQLEWLRADLASARGSHAIFVAMHRPIYSWFQGDFNPDDGETLHDLFRSHGVEAVFSCHDHFFYEEQHDGVRYVTAGGAGGPLYTQPPGGGFAHYLLITVGADGAEMNVVEPNHLDVEYLTGNDGVAPVSTARLANTTDRDLVARNLEFRVPHLPDPGAYAVSATVRDFARHEEPLRAVPARLATGPDEVAVLGVEVPLPRGCGVWVTVDARRIRA